MRRLIAIVGPTASGKTALALTLARRLSGEVIGADSRQVYRHMDIGTAKPTAEERAVVPHHLIDIVEPDQPFSLGRWLELAQAAIDDAWSRGAQPLLVGGTGQFVWALLEGWRVPRVAPDPEFRARMQGRGAVTLFESVRQVDPAAAAAIGPSNRRRLIRALEVHQATGKPISHWQTKEPPQFESLIIGLRLSRDELYRRIDERVERMMRDGLLDEARRLLALGYGRDLPSLSGIGYKEACAQLAGELTEAEAAARIKTETHRLARHQNTWFKAADPRIRWVEGGEAAAEEALRLAGPPGKAVARGR